MQQESDVTMFGKDVPTDRNTNGTTADVVVGQGMGVTSTATGKDVSSIATTVKSDGSPLELTLTREMIEAFAASTQDTNEVHYCPKPYALAMQILAIIDYHLAARLKETNEYTTYSLDLKRPIRGGRKVSLQQAPSIDISGGKLDEIVVYAGEANSKVVHVSGTMKGTSAFTLVEDLPEKSVTMVVSDTRDEAIITVDPSTFLNTIPILINRNSLQGFYTGINASNAGNAANTATSSTSYVPAAYIFALMSAMLQKDNEEQFKDGSIYMYEKLTVSLRNKQVPVADLTRVRFYFTKPEATKLSEKESVLVFRVGATLNGEVLYSGCLNVKRIEREKKI